MLKLTPWLLGVPLLLLSACASGPIRDEPLGTSFTLNNPDCGIPGSYSATQELQADYDRLIAGGRRNAVLNFSRLGLRAFRLGDFCTAEAAFSEAERVVRGYIAESREAAKARGKFGREEQKIFKGEPYERSMLYFYYGLLFYMQGEYDNARACFRSGQLADAFAEGEEYRADYVSLDYLEALADSHYAGNNVADLLEQAHDIYPEYRYVPPFEPSDNLLVVVESGSSPLKIAGGRYGEALTFSRGFRAGGQSATLFVDGKEVARAADPTEDVYFQAATRGGREVDSILEGQARFKETTDTAGDLAIIGGTIALSEGLKHDDDTVATVGGLVALAGLIAKGFSASTKPEADVRTWDNLPDRIHIFSIDVPPGVHTIRADVFDSGGDKLADVQVENYWIGEGGTKRVLLLAAVPKSEY